MVAVIRLSVLHDHESVGHAGCRCYVPRQIRMAEISPSGINGLSARRWALLCEAYEAGLTNLSVYEKLIWDATSEEDLRTVAVLIKEELDKKN